MAYGVLLYLNNLFYRNILFKELEKEESLWVEESHKRGIKINSEENEKMTL